MSAQVTSSVPPLRDETGALNSLRRRLRAVVALRNAARNLVGRLRGALAALETERRRREMTREFHMLDDWTLADIGLKRDGIESIVRGERPFRW